MHMAVYNSAIPNFIANTPNPGLRAGFAVLWAVFFGVAPRLHAADWNVPEQQLARKIVAVTGPGAVALSLEDRSSLGRRDSEVIQNGLRTALESLGLRYVNAEQAAAMVTISLSENADSYVWVAEIHQGPDESSVAMVAIPRREGSAAVQESVPLVLRKIPLWTQQDPILDVAVLEENPAPTHIAVLAPGGVWLYRWEAGKWQPEQRMSIAHDKPWPRDLRGRLIPAKDHLVDVYLPGVTCRSAATPPALNCRESDDPWPLISGGGEARIVFASPMGGTTTATATAPEMRAFFAPTRNFFTGALIPGVGRFTTVAKFFSAAALPREKYTLWLFTATDGQVHMLDGMSDRAAKFDWGSDLASVKTSCGAGWQLLAANSAGDSVRAYEFPDRDPVAVSPAVDFPGTITALWAEAKGDTAIAVARNRDTGSYESFRMALACSQ
jgi:hypothetical protein